VEALARQWNSYDVDFSSLGKDFRGRMARGEELTAGDVATVIHWAARVARSLRRCSRFEREFNELILIADPIHSNRAATYYYERPADTPLDVCLSERLSASSDCVAGLYAHAKRTFSFFLGSTPDLPYRFEFPDLSPEESKQADQILSELASLPKAK
jgi:hypothetical protein